MGLAIKLIQDEEMQDVIDNIEKEKENEKDVDDDVAANGYDRQDDYDEIMNNDKSIEKMKQLNNTKIIVSNHIIKIPNSNYNITKITPTSITTTSTSTSIIKSLVTTPSRRIEKSTTTPRTRKTPPSPLMSPPSRTKTTTKETLTTTKTTPKQQQKKTNDDEYKQQLKQKHDIATTRRNRHRSARDAALAIKLIQDEEMQDVIDNIEEEKENEKDVVDDDVAANGCDRQDDYDEIMNNDKSIEKM